MATNKPTQKVAAAGVAGAITTIIVFVINTYVVPDKPISAEIGAALTTVLSFMTSYFTPPAPRDKVVTEPTPT
jgi:hypothetical protein